MVLTHVQSLYDHSHILHLVATYWHTPRIYIPVATHTYKPREVSCKTLEWLD
jgi:hypothetical protein